MVLPWKINKFFLGNAEGIDTRQSIWKLYVEIGENAIDKKLGLGNTCWIVCVIARVEMRFSGWFDGLTDKVIMEMMLVNNV